MNADADEYADMESPIVPQFETDLKRFMSSTPNPSMLRQISANFKRRLLQFIKNSKEIVLNVQMVVFILIQVVFLQTIL
jgi:pilus assembly protein TadC